MCPELVIAMMCFSALYPVDGIMAGPPGWLQQAQSSELDLPNYARLSAGPHLDIHGRCTWMGEKRSICRKEKTIVSNDN